MPIGSLRVGHFCVLGVMQMTVMPGALCTLCEDPDDLVLLYGYNRSTEPINICPLCLADFVENYTPSLEPTPVGKRRRQAALCVLSDTP
jgi:hypothetical protein